MSNHPRIIQDNLNSFHQTKIINEADWVINDTSYAVYLLQIKSGDYLVIPFINGDPMEETIHNNLLEAVKSFGDTIVFYSKLSDPYDYDDARHDALKDADG